MAKAPPSETRWPRFVPAPESDKTAALDIGLDLLKDGPEWTWTFTAFCHHRHPLTDETNLPLKLTWLQFVRMPMSGLGLRLSSRTRVSSMSLYRLHPHRTGLGNWPWVTLSGFGNGEILTLPDESWSPKSSRPSSDLGSAPELRISRPSPALNTGRQTPGDSRCHRVDVYLNVAPLPIAETRYMSPRREYGVLRTCPSTANLLLPGRCRAYRAPWERRRRQSTPSG